MVIADHHSRNSELLSCLTAAVYMSQAESFRLLQKALPKLGKACAGL
jgi:hypothetical protein